MSKHARLPADIALHASDPSTQDKKTPGLTVEVEPAGRKSLLAEKKEKAVP